MTEFRSPSGLYARPMPDDPADMDKALQFFAADVYRRASALANELRAASERASGDGRLGDCWAFVKVMVLAERDRDWTDEVFGMPKADGAIGNDKQRGIPQ